MIKYFLILILFLGACSNTSQDSGLTPLPSSKDPTDEMLFEAVTKYVTQKGAPPNSVYDHVRVDLNGDGLRDALVLFKLPHTYWCGWDGCGLAIFKATHKGFAPLSNISGARGPLYISRTGSQGWRDIILRRSGTNMRDKNIVMQFNGTSYPTSYPTSVLLAPTYHKPLNKRDYTAYFR